MSVIVYVSFDTPPADDRGRSVIVGKCRQALRTATESTVVSKIFSSADGSLLSAGDDAWPQPANRRFASTESSACLFTCAPAYSRGGGDGCTPEKLLSSPDPVRALTEADPLAVPWGVLLVGHPSTGATAVTDPVGLAHIYYCQARGWAAVSTSAIVLGYLLDAQFDQIALATFATVGHLLGQLSPFEGVSKLDAGHGCTIESGICTPRAYRKRTHSVSPRPIGDAAKEGAAVVRKSILECVETYPDAAIELSGGLDSRVILAALPPDLRRGRSAVTLSSTANHDAQVAARLATLTALEFQTVDLAELGELSVDAATSLLHRASRATGYNANPFARAVLDWSNEQMGSCVRLTGQNGEAARGFYYAGQSDNCPRTPERVSSLARWRIFANDMVHDGVFAPSWRQELRRSSLGVVQQLFSDCRDDWLASTDDFYVYVRMQRWVGVGFSASATRRPILAPFFQQEFLDWALGVSSEHKRGSRLWARVLNELDPRLARLPTAGSSPPITLYDTGLTARTMRAWAFARKAGAKIAQRLAGSTRPPVGAPALCARLLSAHPTLENLLPRVTELDFIDRETTLRVADWPAQARWSTVGFLLNLEGILTFMESCRLASPEE